MLLGLLGCEPYVLAASVVVANASGDEILVHQRMRESPSLLGPTQTHLVPPDGRLYVLPVMAANRDEVGDAEVGVVVISTVDCEWILVQKVDSGSYVITVAEGREPVVTTGLEASTTMDTGGLMAPQTARSTCDIRAV
jgi:hypothetical protein